MIASVVTADRICYSLSICTPSNLVERNKFDNNFLGGKKSGPCPSGTTARVGPMSSSFIRFA